MLCEHTAEPRDDSSGSQRRTVPAGASASALEPLEPKRGRGTAGRCPDIRWLQLLRKARPARRKAELRFFASAPGGAYDKVLVLATAIEIIHTASLVHDDILDDADTRTEGKEA